MMLPLEGRCFLIDLSIVIPSYNERENVRLIADEIRQVLASQDCRYEIVFVDDSSDDTPQVLDELSRQYGEVKYIHRSGEKGLATAVVTGFRQSRGKQIIVMDCDLQHPPALIPLIVKRLSEADVVIPSRFVAGGSDGGLNLWRKVVSWVARTIGQLSVSKIREISDCTGGYFGLRCDVIRQAELDPIGWKILLEVLVRGDYRTVHEIPYSFAARDRGASKMSIREQWNYLRHLAKLVAGSSEDRRFYSFCLVGALGVVVNMLALTVALKLFPEAKVAASVVASLVAMIHNFLWNEGVTWKTRQQAGIRPRTAQFVKFGLVSGFGIALTAFFVRAFLGLGLSVYFGQLTGIIAATYWNFTMNDKWTWSGAAARIKPVVTQEYVGKVAWTEEADLVGKVLDEKRGTK
ncbi:MAG: glycosyltransferase family 2 protein [Negativicutes bacterium]|nr:glycosyltransferase family 2 protein [Negativicutes bacterium]